MPPARNVELASALCIDVGVKVSVDVVGVQQLDPVVRERARRWASA